jgi:Lrp/AsnC family transcriptional regulator for asnA, asnC and gidA
VPSATKIDEIDTVILRNLIMDGRKEFTKIAEEAHVSKDVIWHHYTRMKKEGIIVGATIQLNYSALGYDVAASFFIYTSPAEQELTIQQLRKIRGLYDAYRWGSHSLIWAVSDLMKAGQIDNVKQLIKKLPSVSKVEVEVWTGKKRIPENLSVFADNKKLTPLEKTGIHTEKRNKETAGKIDNVDKQIIERLAVNARASFNDIAKKLGISISTVARRFDKLKRNGVIRAVIQINPIKIGYPASASFRLAIGPKGDLDSIAERIAEIPDVVSILKTTGVYDLTVDTRIKSLNHFAALESEIAKIEGIIEMAPAMLNQSPVMPYPREHMSTF